MDRYAIIVTVLASDARGAIRNTLRAIAARLDFRDLSDSADLRSYQAIYLLGTERQIMLHLGVAAAVSETIKGELTELPEAGRHTLWFGSAQAAMTREQMLARLIIDAGHYGCTRYFAAQPGDAVATLTEANFAPTF